MPDVRILQRVRPEPLGTIAEGLDGAAFRRAAMTHEATLRNTARPVFGRWAELIGQ